MRVLHVISSLAIKGGGTTAALVGMASAQRAVGLNLGVAATWNDEHPPEAKAQLERIGIEVDLIGPATGRLRNHVSMVPVLTSAIQACDIVQIHGLYEEIQHASAAIARMHGKPYIISPHGMLDPWSLNQSWLKKKAYFAWRTNKDVREAAAINYTSETECERGRALGLNQRAIVEPLGVDLAEFENLPVRGTFRASHPKLIGRPVITFMGRIYPQKGLELLVPAMADARLTDAMLVIVGPDQNFQATVEGWISGHGLVDRVLFTGMLRGRARVAALVDSDLFAMPSYHENFGLAVVEALACGVPVVVSDEVNIHREIAAAGVGGVARLNRESVAKELDRGLHDESLRSIAMNAARPFVWNHYDWRRIAERWVTHYTDLLAS